MNNKVPKIAIRQWSGRYSNSDAHDNPPGAAQSQSNLQCLIPGRLDVRGGLVPCTFANTQANTTSNVISMYAAHRPADEWVVYQLADGSIHAGRTPS